MLQTRKAAPAEGGSHNDRRLLDHDQAPVTIGAADVKIELLLLELGTAIGPIEAQFNCLAAMVAAGDSTGVVYDLSRLKALCA
jgi:hypothetical protein